MNQILSVDNVKGKSKGPMEVSKIAKFFSVALILFGIFMIGTGSYSMMKKGQDTADSGTKPTIVVENKSENIILVKAMHDKEIDKLVYYWNSDEPKELLGNGRKYLEEVINIPGGTNVLHMNVSDIYGQTTPYEETYTTKSDIAIDFEVSGNNIKVKIDGQNELSYFTYRWDEDEETKVDINNDATEEEIEIPKGLHKLTIVVVDVNNSTETKTQEVNGVTKPTIEISTDGENFIVKVTDEQGLSKVEFILNETEKYRQAISDKEFEYSFPLKEGENKIEVRAYNTNDVKEVVKRKFTK